MADMLICCDRCDFQFDAMDDRAYLSTKDSDWGALCPHCAVEVLRSTDAWCVWNDCQGIWPETADARKANAENFLKTTHSGIEGRVVPIRMFPEPEDRIGFRECHERENH